MQQLLSIRVFTKLFYKPILLTACLFLMLCLSIVSTSGQIQTVEYEQKIIQLNKLFNQHEIDNDKYLSEANKILPNLYGSKNWDENIAYFKKAIEKSKDKNTGAIQYYEHQLQNAMTSNQLGKGLFYIEKQHQLKYPPKDSINDHSSKFVIAQVQIVNYLRNSNIDKAKKVYHDILPELDKIPGELKEYHGKKHNFRDAFLLAQLLMQFGIDNKDSIMVYQNFELLQQIHNARKGMIIEGKLVWRKFNAIDVLQSEFNLFRYKKEYNNAIQKLKDINEAVQDTSITPLSLRKPNFFRYYKNACQFYTFHYKNVDSAQKYLKLFEEVAHGLNDPYIKKIILLSKAKLFCLESNYKEANTFNEQIIAFQDTLLSLTSEDLEANQYAQAKQIETQEQLLTSEQKNQQEQLFNRTLLLLIAITVISSFFIIIWFKTRQKNKQLNYQLSLAGNLHDETGPMLLYAKMLAQKQSKSYSEEDATELVKHINSTMEAMRGLSHDLKSDTMLTTDNLYHDVLAQLEKIKNTIDLKIETDNSVKTSPIGFFQYNELKKILNELITNTIKHSESDTILISFEKAQKELIITYSDNGKGWDTKEESGIGLHNIMTRTQKINGSISINNNYPNGYFITIKSPLFKS